MSKSDKKDEKVAAKAATATAPTNGAEADDFKPEGWTEVSSSGAPIYKAEAGLAEGVDLEGIAYDTILCLGGASDCGVWEGIMVRATKPTIGFRGDERVEVAAGEDVMIPHEALLGEVARRAVMKQAQLVKIRPSELKQHASKKGWQFWDFRIAFGPKVDREEQQLFRAPERPEIFAKLEEFVANLKGATPKETDAKILASFAARKRVVEATVLAEANVAAHAQLSS